MVSWEDPRQAGWTDGGQEDGGSEQQDRPGQACTGQLRAQSAGLGWEVDTNRLGSWGPLATRRLCLPPLCGLNRGDVRG